MDNVRAGFSMQSFLVSHVFIVMVVLASFTIGRFIVWVVEKTKHKRWLWRDRAIREALNKFTYKRRN